jgi:hypothetical protein
MKAVGWICYKLNSVSAKLSEHVPEVNRMKTGAPPSLSVDHSKGWRAFQIMFFFPQK